MSQRGTLDLYAYSSSKGYGVGGDLFLRQTDWLGAYIGGKYSSATDWLINAGIRATW